MKSVSIGHYFEYHFLIISNIPIVWETDNQISASVDRIDSTIGYKKDNLQIVALCVNQLKNDLTVANTKQILEEIINYNKQ